MLVVILCLLNAVNVVLAITLIVTIRGHRREHRFIYEQSRLTLQYLTTWAVHWGEESAVVRQRLLSTIEAAGRLQRTSDRIGMQEARGE